MPHEYAILGKAREQAWFVVEDGAKPIKNWDGPRWAPNGAGLYLQSSNGKWWPSSKFFADGYLPCKACLKPPPEIVERA